MIADYDILTAGDRPDVLVAMNPAALKANVGDLPRGGLIIANSDPAKVRWYAYDLSEDDALTNGRIFYDAGEAARTQSGMPDGLKVDVKGNIWATGPGSATGATESGSSSSPMSSMNP